MAGNPFRRPQNSKEHDGIDSDNSTRSAQTAEKKRVKIQTPPRSPETTVTPLQDATGRRVNVTPAKVRQAGSLDGSDSSDAEDEGPEEADLSVRYGVRAEGIPAKSPGSGKGAPYNPFARTLATSEAERERETTSSQERGETLQSGRENDHRPERPVIDVDAFTNILLTGKAATTTPAFKAPLKSTTSPSTTTSPISGGLDGRIDPMATFSRNPIFNQSYNLHPESPRTSFDYDRSDSEDDGYGNDGGKLMGASDFRSQDIAPQAPPKPKIRGPQTVSFADFDQSIPPGFQASSGRKSPPANTHLHGILRPSYARSPSDLNKPLPLPPQDPFMSPTASTFPSEPAPLQLTDIAPSPPLPAPPPVEATQEPASAKKKPPPPPATRRVAASSDRPRGTAESKSDPSLAANRSLATERKSSDPTTKASSQPPPPPPPSRKAPSQAVVEAVVADEQVNATPSALVLDTKAAPDAKSTPRPPPRRQLSRSGSTTSYTPPEVSTPPIRDETVSEPSKQSQTLSSVPPPPPRRRGGASSKRSSGEHSRRLSTHSSESDRNASVSSLPKGNLESVVDDDEAMPGMPLAPSSSSVPQGTQRPDQSTILADMSAFQAEIDALVAKADRGETGGSGG